MDDHATSGFWAGPSTVIVAELDSTRVEAYWTAIAETLRIVLGVEDATSVVAAARGRLDRAGPETRLLFHQASPFQVASDLVGSPATELEEEDLANYRAIIERFDPALFPPR